MSQLYQPRPRPIGNNNNNFMNNMNNNINNNNKRNLLNRQTSVLRSIYPTTKWCAIYVNTGNSNNNNNNLNINANELLSQIPKSDSYISMTVEESIISDILSGQENEDKKMSDIRSKKEIEELQKEEKLKREEEERRNKEQQKRMEEDRKNKEQEDKVNQLLNLCSNIDREKARHFLIKYNWDMEKAAEASWTNVSMGNISLQDNNNNNNNNNWNNIMNLNSSRLLITLPDNRSFTFNLNADDTFWAVYGKILQSAPDLSSKAFTFIVPDNHKLDENEFDKTLATCKCVPEGNIRIVFN